VDGAYGVWAVDFDRDGLMDVLAAGRDDGTISVHRQVGAIDSLQYIASYPDLILAFGANAAAGQQHYASFGRSEGRVLDDFNETQYLANYADLQAAFGNDTYAATIHYIQNGFAEGRHDLLP
jgi:hypothetical protein